MDKGVLIMTDLLTPEQLYAPIAGLLKCDLIIISNISANVARELGRVMMMDLPFAELTDKISDIGTIGIKNYAKKDKKLKIVISVISDRDFADRIADVFRNHIKKDGIEIETWEYKTLLRMLQSGDNSQALKETNLVLTINSLASEEVRILTIHELNSTEGRKLISDHFSEYIPLETLNEIDKDIYKLYSIEGISSTLEFLNPEKVVDDISQVIEFFEKYYGVSVLGYVRMNLYLHIAHMVERLMKYGDADIDAQSELSPEQQRFFDAAVQGFKHLCGKYNFSIPNNEMLIIYEIMKSSIE
jgi:transcriptional regulatory protein LevR